MIVAARTPAHIEAAGVLFREYADSVGVDLEFQGFSEEVASLPGDYAPPFGELLLYLDEGRYLGCVALRRLEEGICEMKRLYVAPAGRGMGVGRELARAVIDRARSLGYRTMRLDTLETMSAARKLYLSLGFVPTEAYCHNPLPGAEFYELEL